ncbi:Uncharacterised protein [Vibrio cholerae]|nr:Uncharacterised protein [Vibrio cholerae]
MCKIRKISRRYRVWRFLLRCAQNAVKPSKKPCSLLTAAYLAPRCCKFPLIGRQDKPLPPI